MAGSRRWYIYIADSEERYGVEMDEDKAGVAGAGFVAVTAGDDVTTLPRGMKMRGVNATRTTGAGAGFVSEFQPCATDDSPIFEGTQKTFTRNGQTYSTSSTKGESRRIPKALNTGLVGASPTVAVGDGGGGGGT